MAGRLFAYLQLMRIPNIFTAIADVMAGFLLVNPGRGPISWRDLFALMLATSCIYAGGCVLNDIHDREEDAVERPGRPLPSGRVTEIEAVLLVMALFGAGLLSAAQAGKNPLIVATVLVLFVAAYDLLSKGRDWIGPLNMAGCRAVNLILGMSDATLTLPLILFPILSFAYVFGLTVLSTLETGGKSLSKLLTANTAIAFLVLLLSGMMFFEAIKWEALPLLVLLLVMTMPALVKASLRSAPQNVGRAVKYLILGIAVLDAAYVSGIHGWVYAVPVVLCLLPATLLAKYFYVT